MKPNHPLVSIIMPTLNSGKTIGLSLESISKQSYPKDKIEILVIDGGSKDDTLKIAKKFGATILPNPKIQPEHAKSIGLKTARGDYAMFLDSDEVLQNPDSLQKKINLLTTNQSCKNIVTSGLKTPPNYPFLCDYINKIGDPFSYFVYRIDSGNYFKSLKDRYSIINTTKDYEVVGFKKGELTPIVDGGGHLFDLNYLKSIEDIEVLDLSARVFSSMVDRTYQLGVLKDDFIEHYSSPGIHGYLKKIKWRIISNLSLGNKNIPGYKNRERYLNTAKKIKKYLFVPYSLLVIPVVLDSVLLTQKNKDIRFLIHIPLSIYTAIEIIIQGINIIWKGKSLSAGSYGS